MPFQSELDNLRNRAAEIVAMNFAANVPLPGDLEDEPIFALRFEGKDYYITEKSQIQPCKEAISCWQFNNECDLWAGANELDSVCLCMLADHYQGIKV